MAYWITVKPNVFHGRSSLLESGLENRELECGESSLAVGVEED